MRRNLFVALIPFALACQRVEQASTHSDSEQSSAAKLGVTVAPPRTLPCGEEVISNRGIGDLELGATVESVKARCVVVRDTTVLADEGMRARKLLVALSRDTVEAEVVGGKVWRIAVLSGGIRTADSLGVSTPLSRLLQLRDARGITGEGRLFVVSPDHCGLSFRLSNSGPASHRGEWDRAALERLPKSTVVSQILVIGCQGAAT